MLDVEKEYIKITGREALGRLLEGEEVYSVRGKEAFKIIDDKLRIRDYFHEEPFEESSLELNTFLDPGDVDWYVAPPFDARKELFERPNEWVAKYYVESDHDYYYLGFDTSEMATVYSRCLEPTVNMWGINSDSAGAEMLDNAIPLSEEDLKVLSAFKNK